MYTKYAELRDKKGLTDYKVAQVSGLPMSMFSDWKSGRSTPKVNRLNKVSKVLDCSILDLLGLSDADE